MEDFSKSGKIRGQDNKFKHEIYSKVFKAGQRTYFLDVKSTRDEELYLTITESKKHLDKDGRLHFEKHKIFLYREDFDKFANSLTDVISYIRERQPIEINEYYEEEPLEIADDEMPEADFTNVSFEDLSR